MQTVEITTLYIKDLVFSQVNTNKNPADFVAWLLENWSYLPGQDQESIAALINSRLGEAKGAAAEYIKSRYGAWLPVVAVHSKTK